jgi:hypothetical protein
MTAEPHHHGHPIPSRTPAAIRVVLADSDRTEFEREYQAALTRAGVDYDLAPVHDLLDRWWQIAVLTADARADRRMLDAAAALRAGRAVPGIPWPVVRADLGL